MGGQELTKYEAEQLTRIEQWEAEEPGVVSKAVGFITAPLAWAAQKVIPEAAIRGALDLSNSAAKFLADSDDLLRDARVSSLPELKQLPLERLDELANEVHNWAVAVATGEGAGTGAAGLPGMVVDVPLVITIALRTIHKIGLCYGYECKDEVDVQFVYAVLSASGANSVKEKVAALAFLQELRVILVRQTWKAMSEKMAATQVSKEGALIALRNLAKQLGVNLTKRKALQVVPAVGAAVGGSANGWWLKEVGWAARRSFQKRWLEDHGKLAAHAA
ncbi:EcsC family protein [Anaeromyxobacter sp. SG26]|uniref:EcsC family protein n=1 Tax=Anaeromyxobacter sp. SG26 TaxID=2925407 RepID=UPI001F5AAD00|nr:EcsC family protein [Anaeromyxobacter sp. SG26]